MNADRSRPAITALRWTIGIVIGIEAALFLFSPGQARAFRHSGMPDVIRIVLGGAELAGAVLFLLPATIAWGGCCLFATFVLAAAVHVLHGQPNVGNLIIYAMAVFAVLAQRAARPAA